ncbi:MAG TPA: hypothetical protein VJA25_00085 [Dehalococcoidia bacterium]|nr:hypothetical protein [Dehalococcoidia bacterium]
MDKKNKQVVFLWKLWPPGVTRQLLTFDHGLLVQVSGIQGGLHWPPVRRLQPRNVGWPERRTTLAERREYERKRQEETCR